MATQIFFIFAPKIGKDSHFDSYFSIGLKPPTRYAWYWWSIQYCKQYCFNKLLLKYPLDNPSYTCRYRFKKLPLGTRTRILILETNPLTKNNKHDLVGFWTSCNSSQFDLHYTQIKPLRRLQGKNCWDGITRASRSVWTIWVAFIMLVEPWNRKGQQRGVLVHGCKNQDASSFFQGLKFSLRVDDYIPSISW